jgi:hypothetical protein
MTAVILHRMALGFLVPLLVCGAARADSDNPGTGRAADKVIEFFRMDAFFGDAATWYSDAVARAKKDGPIPEGQLQTMDNLGKRILPPKNIVKIFKTAYIRAITPDNLKKLSDWMLTPQAIQLRTAYAKTLKVGAKARQAYVDGPGAAQLKPNRKNAIRTFTTAWGHEPLFVACRTEMDYVVRLALNAFLPPNTREVPKILKDAVLARKSTYVEPASAYYRVFDAYLLKDLRSEQIDELSKFAETAVGEAHVKAMQKALEATIDAAGKTMADQIIKGER